MAVSFLINKSQGLKFLDTYKEEFTPTNYFSATKEQFYNSNYNPNEAQGLGDMSLWFFPMSKIGGSIAKETGGMIYEGSKVILQKGSNKVSSLAIPTAVVGLSDYANAPTSNNDKLYNGPTDTTLIIGAGLLANQGTKMLSQTILKQNAKTSIKAGLAGAGLDASSQIGTQIYTQAINNNGYVNFNDINLDYDSIAFSGVAGAVTIPTVFKSYDSIKYSIKAKKELQKQLKTKVSPNRIEKLNDKIIENKWNIRKNIIFQIGNYESKEVIKNSTISNKNE